jgi:hypothetical protein
MGPFCGLNGLGSSNNLPDVMLADKLDRIWRCAAEMLAKAAEDKVYKVYLAALKGMRCLMAFAHFTQDQAYIRAGIRPILHSILLKCADGHKRMAEISLEAILEICQEEVFAIGTCGQKQRSEFPQSRPEISDQKHI